MFQQFHHHYREHRSHEPGRSYPSRTIATTIWACYAVVAAMIAMAFAVNL